jgi:hypothetical protein
MLLKEIQRLWDEDSPIAPTDLINQSLRIPYLHAKYYRVFMDEKMQLLLQADEVRALKFRKTVFFTDGPNGDEPDGWELPPKGRIMKAEVDRYVDNDPEVVALVQKLQLQTEKTKFVESIISSLTQRGFAIKNALDVMRFQAGN